MTISLGEIRTSQVWVFELKKKKWSKLIEDKNGIGGHRGDHCPGCKLRKGRQLKYVQVNNEDPLHIQVFTKVQIFYGGCGGKLIQSFELC